MTELTVTRPIKFSIRDLVILITVIAVALSRGVGAHSIHHGSGSLATEFTELTVASKLASNRNRNQNQPATLTSAKVGQRLAPRRPQDEVDTDFVSLSPLRPFYRDVAFTSALECSHQCV